MDLNNSDFINTDTKYIVPDYKSRYDFFVAEFIQYNAEIPDELKQEYELLFKMFADANNNNNLQKYKIDINEEIPLPEIILSICDVDGNNKRMVMTRQNISCVTAQAKVGKTFLIKLIISCCLKKKTFQNRLNSEMPDGRDKILYIDTEQSKFHVQLGLKQIKSIIEDHENNNNDFEVVSENIDVYQFDAVDTDSRYAYVKELVYSKKYSLVIIDGISDLSVDTNDLKLADRLVTDLRIWATENDLHILNVIHLNPGDLSHKMKGHLGTKLADKSETVLGVSIDKDNDNVRIVKSLATRNRKPDPFAFEISENGNPEIIDYEIGETKPRQRKETVSKKDKLNSNATEIINLTFSNKGNANNENLNDKGIMYADLKDRIKRAFLKITSETLGDSYAKDFIKESTETSKILYEPANKRYFLGENVPF